MTDSELREIYTRALTSRATVRDQCPTPEALEALVARRGTEESRLATLDHVMSCLPCTQDFELLRAIHAAEVANAQARHPRRSRTPWFAAAAVVVAVGTLTVAQLRRPNPTRGAGASADIALVGTVNHTLVWRSVPGAIRYDVEIVDASGATIFSARSSDTTVVLPATLPSSELNWWVRATLRDGSERRSAVVALE